MAAIPLFQVDAFSDMPFAGNPAGVCLLDSPRPEAWMKALAAEMNLSETAFLLPEADGYRLRWFTPAVEVDLCGHATLASTHVLYETGRLAPDCEAKFYTRSGLLTARLIDGRIELNFPAQPVRSVDDDARLKAALGIEEALFIGKKKDDYLVELASPEAVRSVNPDFSALQRVEGRGVIITASGDGQPYDFVSRFFAPNVGVNEDPVTGSAHCALIPYWAEKLGKTELMAYQASKRGGVLRVQLDGDRVRIAGKAVTVFRTEIDF